MTKPTGRPRGRPKTKEYVTLMARVPQELADRVQHYARLHQQPISIVLRDGLELLLEEDRYRPFLSDMNGGSYIVSDTKEDTSSFVYDTKEASTAVPPAPGILSDRNEPAFDRARYVLGKLCPLGHEHGDTGKSLLRGSNRHCLACDREKFHERKQAKRQTTPA